VFARRTRTTWTPLSAITIRSFAGDAQALMTGMEENARQNPNKQLDILRALEDF
jgi:hypothetical protein